MRIHHPSLRRRGVSLVELMVGVTIGLFILAAATLVVTSQLGDNRRMLTDTQLQQDMRATVDIAMRDIRRAGFNGRSWMAVWPNPLAANPLAEALNSPYSTVSASQGDQKGDSITYRRSNVTGRLGLNDDGKVSDDESAGFRFNASAGTVEMMVSDKNWQALTDSSVMKVTQFDIAYTSHALPLPCGTQCQRGPNDCPMDLLVRDVAIVMSAQSAHDANIKRSVASSVRLRNDVLVERSKPC
jgi:type IV pilus assembly protein PilW